jgi:hypothetical protein
MADTDELAVTVSSGRARWGGEGVLLTVWSIAAVAAQVASYRAVEGAPTGADRLVIATGLALAVAAVTIAVAGGLTGRWHVRRDAPPHRRLLAVALLVAAQTAWYVAELADRAAQRTDDPVWVALPVLHIAIAALAGGAVLTGVRLVLVLADDARAGPAARERRRSDPSS